MKKELKLFLFKCPKCGAKNYEPAIPEGVCVYCEYEAVADDVDGVNVDMRLSTDFTEEELKEEIELKELREFGNQFDPEYDGDTKLPF